MLRAVQVMQNKAARAVTKLSWFTPTRTLLLQCNWLIIKQLIFYHTALQVWRVLASKCPVYIHSNLQLSATRSAAQGNLRVPPVETDLAGKSFMVRAAAVWNTVPPDIRNIKTIHTFKKKLKQWSSLVQHGSGQPQGLPQHLSQAQDSGSMPVLVCYVAVCQPKMISGQ